MRLRSRPAANDNSRLSLSVSVVVGWTCTCDEIRAGFGDSVASGAVGLAPAAGVAGSAVNPSATNNSTITTEDSQTRAMIAPSLERDVCQKDRAKTIIAHLTIRVPAVDATSHAVAAGRRHLLVGFWRQTGLTRTLPVRIVCAERFLRAGPPLCRSAAQPTRGQPIALGRPDCRVARSIARDRPSQPAHII